jgi:hypothetical protein
MKHNEVCWCAAAREVKDKLYAIRVSKGKPLASHDWDIEVPHRDNVIYAMMHVVGPGSPSLSMGWSGRGSGRRDGEKRGE